MGTDRGLVMHTHTQTDASVAYELRTRTNYNDVGLCRVGLVGDSCFVGFIYLSVYLSRISVAFVVVFCTLEVLFCPREVVYN